MKKLLFRLLKKRNIILGTCFLFIAGSLLFTSCKKDNSSDSSTNPNSLTSQQAMQVQNADAQDAIADKTEEDVDNKLDELLNNNYSAVNTKSLLAGLTDTVVITVDHPDTITFPKIITLTYHSYKDSCINESITKNGEIIVRIDVDIHHPRLVTRSFTFQNFSVITDSTTVTLNGTRIVRRLQDALKLNGLQSARISVTDSINATLRFAVVKTGNTDSLIFTRNVKKLRNAITHFRNVKYIAGDPLYNLTHLSFRNQPSLDSLSYTGQVTGINEKGDAYSRTITSRLIIINYRGSLIITSGIIQYLVGTIDSYMITFDQDPVHPHFTLVNILNNNTGKTISFDRRFSRIFRRWW
jgi:hypothetical protein